MYTSDVLTVQADQQLTVHLSSCCYGNSESLTSLLIGEDQRVSSSTGHLQHSGLLRLDERQGHRRRFQHEVITLDCGKHRGQTDYWLLIRVWQWNYSDFNRGDAVSSVQDKESTSDFDHQNAFHWQRWNPVLGSFKLHVHYVCKQIYDAVW